MVYNDLIARLSAALERGEIEPARVEALLRRRKSASGRPDVASVLRAAGVLACLTGAALLYGIGFSSYPVSVQAVTPFLFPAAALGGAIALHRARRPAWEAELAGMVGCLAFGLASTTSAVATGAGPGFGIAASVAATAIVLALHAALRMVRLTGWGLSASLVAFTGCCADAGGILSGMGATSFGRLGPWHLLLTLVVGASLMAAARFDMGTLMWVGALGSIVWLGTLAVIVGDSASWAIAVIVFGLGLVALAALIARRHGRSPAPAGVIVVRW